MLRALFIVSVAGCGKSSETGQGDSVFSTSEGDSGWLDDSNPDSSPSLDGFIGSPCSTDTDCEYEDGVCLLDGFPNGMCSLACESTCPDRDGFPVTFCVDGGVAPGGFPDDEGWCVSRCSFGAYQESGCRPDYGCSIESRNEQPWTETYTCLPHATSDLEECHYRLADRGVGFEPTVRAPDSPEGHPELTCTIEDPVWVFSPVFDVDLDYYDGTPTPRTLASCAAAHSIADTADDAAKAGVASILHIGTYNCRVIAGTSTLSRHGYGDALDIYGFRLINGETWTLIDHWEHDTTSPTTESGRFLYDIAHRWYDAWIWNIILTPNYNTAHDNHFHLDLTPGWHDLSIHNGRYIGPAPYTD